MSSYRHTPKYRRPEKCGSIIVDATPRVIEGRDDEACRSTKREHTIRALHEPYSIVICRWDAPTFGIEPSPPRRHRFDVNACLSTPVEHAARFFITANCDPPCGGTLSLRTFAIHKCFFHSKGAWHIDCAYSVSTRTEGGESNEKYKITFSRSDSSR